MSTLPVKMQKSEPLKKTSGTRRLTVNLMLTMRSQGYSRDEHQRVGNAVRGHQQRQLLQDEPLQSSVCTIRLPLVVMNFTSGGNDKGKESEAFIETHSTCFYLRQAQDQLEEYSKFKDEDDVLEVDIDKIGLKTLSKYLSESEHKLLKFGSKNQSYLKDRSLSAHSSTHSQLNLPCKDDGADDDSASSSEFPEEDSDAKKKGGAKGIQQMSITSHVAPKANLGKMVLSSQKTRTELFAILASAAMLENHHCTSP
ncbi:hypothetical protein ATANTOWER_009272 [Ataeniobius toweri]|uniref:Uncharacterized protein n=1 Tax=Ataeniobius toweri TaxID=208326 RepID=A0ABU7AXM8_9TELE|nr:hypothetical protein [Ataeniobius toweri]